MKREGLVYAEYYHYRNEFCGTMGEEAFSRLSRRASSYLDALTLGQIQLYSDTDRIRDACCAVADAMLLNEQGGGIASETNDGISVNYLAGVSKAKTDNERLYEAASLYLAGTGLLYRGV